MTNKKIQNVPINVVNNMSIWGGGRLVQNKYNNINKISLNKHKEFSIFNTRFLYAF